MKNQKKREEKSNCKICKFNENNHCMMLDKPITDTKSKLCIYFEKKKGFSLKSFLLGGFSSLIIAKIFYSLSRRKVR